MYTQKRKCVCSWSVSATILFPFPLLFFSPLKIHWDFIYLLLIATKSNAISFWWSNSSSYFLYVINLFFVLDWALMQSLHHNPWRRLKGGRKGMNREREEDGVREREMEGGREREKRDWEKESTIMHESVSTYLMLARGRWNRHFSFIPD